MAATIEEIRESLELLAENPTRRMPAQAAILALAALDAGREFAPTCDSLGLNARIERVGRGEDGVAYLAIAGNCWQDFAYLALTEGEASLLRVPSLEAQKEKSAAFVAKQKADANTNRTFLRDYDR